MVKDLRKNIAVIGLLIVMLSLPMMGAFATVPTNWTINVTPTSGTSTSSIFLMIRVTPKVSLTQNLHYYIFYDDDLITNSIFLGNTTSGYIRSLDYSFVVPSSMTKYQTPGDHTIKVILEDVNDGTQSTKTATFTITDATALPSDWWLNLPPDFFAYVKGAPGTKWTSGTVVPTNATGAIGDYFLNKSTGDVYTKVTAGWTLIANLKGTQGTAGTNGATGATGGMGPQGPQGPQGNTGAIGPLGPKGDTGATGATGAIGATGASGKDADMFYVWVAVACGIIALVLSLIANARRGEYLEPEQEQETP
jgi:hypothetical protein